MSSPLCNPRFLEHLKQSKAQTKNRMNLKTDRMIDRVYSEVLADLHKFFTFDDGLVRQREVQSDGEPAVLSPCTIMQQHNQSSNITPTDVPTVQNVSQNGGPQFDPFQTSTPQSIGPNNNQSPNNPKSAPPEPHQPNYSITRHHSSSITNVKDEIASDSEENLIDNPMTVSQNKPESDLQVNPAIEFEDEKECECNDCLKDFNRLHQNPSDEQLNDTEQANQSTSHDNEDEEYEVDQETWDELGREIKEEMQERDNVELILASTSILEPRNVFDSVHSLGKNYISINNEKRLNRHQEIEQFESQYAEAQDLDDEDDYEGMSCPTVKKARMVSAQPFNEHSQITGQCPKIETQNPTQSAQPHNANTNEGQMLTLSVQCLKSGCLRVFAQQDQLNLHMWNDHSIRLYRCSVKNCRQSFDKSHILRDHIKLTHQSTTQWYCDKCSKHFSTYALLSSHNFNYHQLGQFKCSFSSCTFTGTYRKKVFNHYATEHKQTLNCQHSGCNYQSSFTENLKRHKRSHFGIKPYRCKWSQCDYASVEKAKTIIHIRGKHLAPKPGSVPNGAQLDPKDYLEVIHELL